MKKISIIVIVIALVIISGFLVFVTSVNDPDGPIGSRDCESLGGMCVFTADCGADEYDGRPLSIIEGANNCAEGQICCPVVL